MADIRLFQDCDMILQQTIWLDERASHYLIRVLRVKTGDDIIIFNGKGGEYHAVIKEITKRGILIEALNFNPQNRESPLITCLAQGIARNDKMDVIIQKAVELGVSHIIPLITARCQYRLNKEQIDKKMHHWQGIIISACEQSGRNLLPILSKPMHLAEWLPQAIAQAKWVLSPHQKPPVKPSLVSTCASFDLLIGPEGGLTEQEIGLANQHDFASFNLGERILRTETATITALSIVQYQFGDLST